MLEELKIMLYIGAIMVKQRIIVDKLTMQYHLIVN